MRRLRLYSPDQLPHVIQRTVAEDHRKDCEDCPLHAKAKTVCMEPEGKAGGLYVISDYPGIHEDRKGRPFVGGSGQLLRQVVLKHWKGPIAFDNAIKCAPGDTKVTDKMVAACRPYSALTLEEVQPTRVIALGPYASRSLFGHSVPPFSVRGGWAWLPWGLDADGWKATPVFFMMNAAAATRNHFLRRWFEEDLKHALTCDDPPLPAWDAETRLVETWKDARDAYLEALEARWVTFDVETSGEMFNSNFRLLSCSVGFSDTTDSWTWDGEGLGDPKRREALVQLLTDPSVNKVGQNVKFDMKAVFCGLRDHKNKPVMVGPISGDTRLWRKLMNTESEANLEVMANLVGMGGHKDEAEEFLAVAVKDLRKKGNSVKARLRKQSIDYDGDRSHLDVADEAAIRLGEAPYQYAYAFLPHDVLVRYNARDSVVTTVLAERLEKQLAGEPEQTFVWDKLVGPANAAFTQVEVWGMGVSKPALEAFTKYLGTKIDEVQGRLNAYVPEFNANSVKQVHELLFDKVGLKSIRTTPSGAPSTDAATLESLKGQHPAVQDILDARGLTKLKGTYGDGLIPHICDDGRIHTTYNLDGARSGRLSSNDPNLQNIPVRTELGRQIRDCFIAPPDHMLMQFDYSQLELRIAADLSGDPLMKQIFVNGEDYHLRTAQMVAGRVWGIAPSEVGKDHRYAAKTINFRTLYGGSDYSNAMAIGCSKDEARIIREAIFGKFTKLASWIQQQLRQGRRTGMAWTYWLGQKARRRNLWMIGDKDEERRMTAERSTWNTPIQGTSSDYCLASVIAVVNWILDNCLPIKLVGTVHDSIMLEAPRSMMIDTAKHVVPLMQSWPTMTGVPLVVDVEAAQSWGSLEKFYECPGCGIWSMGQCQNVGCVSAEMAADLLEESAL